MWEGRAVVVYRSACCGDEAWWGLLGELLSPVGAVIVNVCGALGAVPVCVCEGLL